MVPEIDVDARKTELSPGKKTIPEVTAIIVTYNSAECIHSCLVRLTNELEGIDGEIIVFDNNSSDNTVEQVKAFEPLCKIVESDKNLGFAAANNIAVENAHGKYILFANPDTILDEGSVSRLVSALKKQPDAGAVVGRMRNPDGSFQPTCRKVPNSRNIFLSRGSVLSRMMLPSKRRNPFTMDDFDKITEVPAAAATCMLIDREFFSRIGGFDNRFFLFAEDVDLSVRIRQNDRKVYFVPEAGAVHQWGKGARVSSVKRSMHHHVAVWKYFMKHYPNGFSLFVLPAALFLNFTIRAITGIESK